MSCFGPNYLISTTNPWYRRESVCTDFLAGYLNENLNANGTIYIPILKKDVLITQVYNEFQMYKKGNVLQYAHTHHTNKLTKNQIYASIVQGKWISKKSYATQTETYTNPNNNYLKRVNYDVINVDTGVQTTEPITCPSNTPQTPANILPVNNNTPSVVPNILPPPPPTPSKNKFTLPDIVPVVDTPQNNNIPDGGNLVIGIIENICSGESKIVCNINPIVCFPSSFSDVPRENGIDKELCYIKGTPTWLPGSGINTSSAIDGGQFPTNYKDFIPVNSS
jgi:hypothetical protein